MPLRIVLSNQTGFIMRVLRTMAIPLTLLFILALRPDSVNAQNSTAQVASEGSYQTTAYKKKRRYRKRRISRKKRYRKRRSRPVVAAWPSDATLKGPVQLVISLPNQRVTLFKAGKKIASAPVSTGKAGLRTPSGIFSIIQKHRRHYSNLYGGASMPNMQRITWSGVAMHAGSLPGYPASHGCIRLPHRFSRKLFGYTQMGDHVIVAQGNLVPRSITHNMLFQPVPSSDQLGPRVALEKRATRNTGAANPAGNLETPRISDLVQNNGRVYNTSANDPDWAAASSAQAATITVLKQLAAPDAAVAGEQTHDTQSILRRHLIQKMRDRQWPKDAQRLLKRLGIYKGKVDGDPGRVTIWAIKRFQSGLGMPVTGKIDKDLILTLNRLSGKEIDLSFKNVKLPHSDAPLRILITRKKSHETSKLAQELLNRLGYDTGGIDGALGKMSIAAIRDFQKLHELRVTGELNGSLMTALYKATGIKKPGEWHLYVRQEFLDMFDAPVDVRDSSKPVGTHLYTAMHFEKDATETKWTSMTLRARSGYARRKCKWNRRDQRRVCTSIPAPAVSSTSASKVLDRIDIPADIRSIISELLTPGSSMVVTDNGISHETGKGTDFIILTR